MKRVVRPWDHVAHDLRQQQQRQQVKDAASPPAPSPGKSYSSPSFIEIDDIAYFSDRFYLHRLPTDDDPMSQQQYPWSCSCGARGSPPLLDISRLVASLDLQAAILATYTLDPEWMQVALPSMFGPDAKIPTLVLHGQKGFSSGSPKATSTFNKTEQDPDSPCRDESHSLHHTKTSPQQPQVVDSIIKIAGGDEEEEEDCDNESCFWNTQDNILPPLLATIATPQKSTSPSAMPHYKSATPIRNKKRGTSTMQHAMSSPTRPLASSSSVSPCTYFTKVEPVWVPPSDATTARLEEKERKRGVHHPKYMLLLERRGSLVVVISTANLTLPSSVDASWIQRFEPVTNTNTTTKTKSNIGAALGGKTNKWNDMRRDGSDFGHVLANFLHCQSQAALQHGQDAAPSDSNNGCHSKMLPDAFLKAHACFGLMDLPHRFQFDQSQVHLIATVPGDYAGRHTTQHLGPAAAGNATERSFLYGPQRVADILHRLSSSSNQKHTSRTSTASNISSTTPWLPPSLLSNTDRLIMQTTSIGGKWTRDSMSRIIRSYLGCDNHDHANNPAKKRSRHPHGDLLERMDIVWPSQDFMQVAAATCVARPRRTQRVKSPDAVAGLYITEEARRNTQGLTSVVSEESTNAAFVFMSSESFISMDLSCLSRMVMYEPSDASDKIPPPHIKSVARLLEGANASRLQQDFGKALEYFSWFLLSSACLSHGAQGKRQTTSTTTCDERHVVMTYANFELGVLFCSRWQDQPQTDRLYCWKPAQCSCRRSGEAPKRKQSSLIHLPVPYALRPHPYQNDPDETEFCATPYFHEIPEGTGCIGHMRLTPYGANLASTMRKTSAKI